MSIRRTRWIRGPWFRQTADAHPANTGSSFQNSSDWIYEESKLGHVPSSHAHTMWGKSQSPVTWTMHRFDSHSSTRPSPPTVSYTHLHPHFFHPIRISLSFTLTQVDEQWGLYDGYDRKLEAVLRNRRKTGRHMPIMNVVPPGLDFSNLKVNPWSAAHSPVHGRSVHHFTSV